MSDQKISYKRLAMDLEDRREDLMEDLLSELGSGAYEPSERGAGFAFHDDAVEKAMRVLDTYGVTFRKEKS